MEYRHLKFCDDRLFLCNCEGTNFCFLYRDSRALRNAVRKFLNVLVFDLEGALFPGESSLSPGIKLGRILWIRIEEELLTVRYDENKLFPTLFSRPLWREIHSHICAVLQREKEKFFEVSVGEEALPALHRSCRPAAPSAMEIAESDFESLGEGWSVYSVNFSANRIYVLVSDPSEGFLAFDGTESLLKPVQDFICEICGDEQVLRKLILLSRSCGRCGFCCGFYAVEANPEDVAAMAGFLNLSEEAFIGRYLKEDLFSWNESCYNLKKSAETGHCVFYGVCGDGLDGCTLYACRPLVCRSYFPGNEKCPMFHKPVSRSDLLRWIRSCSITEDVIVFDTEFTRNHGLNSFVLNLEEGADGPPAGELFEKASLFLNFMISKDVR